MSHDTSYENDNGQGKRSITSPSPAGSPAGRPAPESRVDFPSFGAHSGREGSRTQSRRGVLPVYYRCYYLFTACLLLVLTTCVYYLCVLLAHCLCSTCLITAYCMRTTRATTRATTSVHTCAWQSILHAYDPFTTRPLLMHYMFITRWLCVVVLVYYPSVIVWLVHGVYMCSTRLPHAY